MIAEMEQRRALTVDDFYQGKVNIPPEAIADIFRQHSGINLTVGGDYFGHDFTSQRLSLEKKLILTSLEEDFLGTARVWIGKTHAEEMPTIEVFNPHELPSMKGYVDLGKMIKNETQKWVAADSSGRRKQLHELLTPSLEKDMFSYKVIESIVKIDEVLIQSSLEANSPLRTTLESMSTVLKQDAVELLNISESSYSFLREEICKNIHATTDKKPSYLQRALTLLGKEEGQRNVQLFFERMFKDSYAVLLMDRVFTGSADMSLIRMMERFEETGIDFVASRRTIEKLLLDFPVDTPKQQLLSREYEEWFSKMFDVVAPIGNMIFDIPHGDAYQLTQVLTRLQSSCAGKSHLFTELLRSIGLDAVISTSKFFGRQRSDGIHFLTSQSGEHLISGVRLPRGIVVNFDGSLDRYTNIPLLSKFLHNVQIAIPTNSIQQEAQEAIYDEREGYMYRLTSRGFEEYWTIGSGYSVIETAQHPTSFDHLNFAVDQTNFALLTLPYEERDYEALLYGYMREASQFPFDAETLSMLADFMIEHRQGIADALGGDPKGVLHHAVNLLIKANNYNPHYMLNLFLMAQVVQIPEFYEDETDIDGGYMIADELLETIYDNPVSDVDQQVVRKQWINLLENHSGMLISRYRSPEEMSKRVQEMKQKSIVPAEKFEIILHRRN
jgi:hypothetical protein